MNPDLGSDPARTFLHRRGPPMTAAVPLFLMAVLAWKLARLRPDLDTIFYGVTLLWGLGYGVSMLLAYRAFPETLWAGTALATLLTGWSLHTLALIHPGYALHQALAFLLGVLGLYGLVLVRKTWKMSFFSTPVLLGGYLLTSGLMALTLAIGVHPGGQQVRLWLGCCGVYFQPAAWHKVTTLGYLAWGLGSGLKNSTVPLTPSRAAFTMAAHRFRRWLHRHRHRLWWAGLALTGVLLLLQGDLGHLALFLLMTATMTARYAEYRKHLLPGLGLLLVLGGAWAWRLPRVQARLRAWLAPQTDPWGAGYQILQAMKALRRGAWTGTGPALAHPQRVPLVHSDMFYAAVAEIWGWMGAAVLLGGLLLVVYWAFVVALRAGPSTVAGGTAWGLAWWWGLQTALVVGGTLRLLPFTGMPIPFAAYGGSELTAAYLGLTLLMEAWHHPANQVTANEVRALRWAVQIVTVLFALLLTVHGLWLLW